MKFALSRFIMLITVGLTPLSSLYGMRQPRIVGSLEPYTPSVQTIPTTSAGRNWRGFLPSMPSMPSMPKLPSIQLPLKNTAAFALFGGTLLVVGAIIAYKKLSKHKVDTLNETIALLEDELKKFFNTFNTYNSPRTRNELYKFRASEYRYLTQYDIPTLNPETEPGDIPGLGKAIEQLMKQNKNMTQILKNFKSLHPLINIQYHGRIENYLNSIVYEIALFFNRFVKDPRIIGWFFQNPDKYNLTTDQKANILTPIARSIEDLNKLFIEIGTLIAENHPDKQLMLSPYWQNLVRAAIALSHTRPATDATLTNFIQAGASMPAPAPAAVPAPIPPTRIAS